MLQYADKVVAVEQKDGRTNLKVLGDSLSAIDRLSRAGVSRWVDPLLYYPLDPLVLVEGKFDHTFLTAAFIHLRKRRDVRFSYLEHLEPTQKTGGKEDLLRYVQNHASAIKTRRKDAPVIVLLDWDAAAKKESFQKHFKSTDPFKVLSWPDSALNPKLGATFHGIERAYSDRIIEEAEKKGANLFKSPDGTCAIGDAAEYGKIKQILHGVVKEGLEPADLKQSRVFLEEILSAADANL
jgi:5S rRNA maturation endonuclease (ribonuclease M5)